MFDVMKEAEQMEAQTREWRHDFHQHPELGHQEERTAGIVASHLRSLGLEVWDHVGTKGVIALLKGGRPGKVLALRADMDALPLQEMTGLPYASQVPGVMHACGHDGHTAMLMAAASVLSRHRDQIKGTVKFIFQPAEEGGGGASVMVKAGALENPRPDAIIAQHMMFTEAGTVTTHKGYSYLASDTFCIRVHGHGGHAAKPHESTDTILAACKIVTDIQMIVARKISPQDTATVTVGVIQGGTKENIIPDEAELRGTVRSLGDEVQERVIQGLHEICRGVCEALGTTYELEYHKGYKAVYNDPEMMDIITRGARRVLGEDKVYEVDKGRPGSEDFSAYLESGIPGGYFWLGGAYPGEISPSKNHQPTYNWDESALKTGVAAMTAAVLEYLDSWE
ncbi:MAG: amidohydrolase [Eubacteriales bacterium]|nr:amidohydrolase [Eubacteriales bacterium]